MTGYPWATGDALLAADLNAAIVAASSGVASGGPFLPLSSLGTQVNVRDYGAKGDGATNDAAAINAAIGHAVSVLSGGASVVVFFPPGVYRCNGTVNLTGIRAYNAGMFGISGNGATIRSYAAGLPAVDAVWSQCVHINGLTIIGDASQTPTYGLQLGIKDTTGNGNAADWRVTNLTVSGSFSQAAIRNVAAESGCWVGLRISNTHATGDGIRMDGLNHYNLSSAFQAVSLTVNSPLSFNDNLFVGPVIQVQGGKCLWLAGNAGTKFDNGYGSTTGANAVALFTQAGTDFNRHVKLYMHFETTAITDVVSITGPFATPTFQGLEYADFYAEATNSIFKLDTGVTQCWLQGVVLRLGDGAGGWTKVFDAPTAWTVSGSVLMDIGSTKWNLAVGRFSGTLTIGTGTSQAVSSGVTFGTQTGSSVADLSKHIQLHTDNVGFNVTTNRLNYSVAPSGYSHVFTVAGTDIATINASGLSVNAAFGLAAGAATLSAGVNFTGTASSVSDLSKHIQLSSGMGINSQAGRLNITHPSGAYFVTGGADVASFWNDGLHIVKAFGVWGSTIPSAKPTVTGSKGANAALASLLTALASYGLVLDSST